jgi:hypothetical protein
MNRALAAGLVYGAIIVTIGAVLGTLRELVLAPLIGRDVVVLVEGPLILLLAWFLAWWLVRGHTVPGLAGQRLLMGAVAFSVVIAGEAAIAVFGLGRTLAMHLGAYMTAKGVLELLPQLGFAVFPLLHLFRERPQP